MNAIWNWLKGMDHHREEPGRPMAMPVFAGQKLVVVGGSSGMGRQTAADVVAAGGSAVIIGQDQDRVDDTVRTPAPSGTSTAASWPAATDHPGTPVRRPSGPAHGHARLRRAGMQAITIPAGRAARSPGVGAASRRERTPYRRGRAPRRARAAGRARVPARLPVSLRLSRGLLIRRPGQRPDGNRECRTI
jgi:hypothetical protein